MATTPLIVIVGPTASGKTALAVDLATKFNGEIICADSRTVYKGMDIGTAKPTLDEQRRVPHWGIDLVEPDDVFTAADFQRYANQKIADIRKRGKVPFLVGGTGLYVDSVIFDYRFGAKPNADRRRELEEMTLDALLRYCENSNIKLPENSTNKRYIIRAIEQKGINNSSLNEPIKNCIIVGIATNREILRARIEDRAEQLFANGVVKEAIMLGKIYGWGSEAMTGNIYQLVNKYINGELSMIELKNRFIVLDWRLAKRQLTWLRRNQYIEWFGIADARSKIAHTLESWRQS